MVKTKKRKIDCSIKLKWEMLEYDWKEYERKIAIIKWLREEKKWKYCFIAVTDIKQMNSQPANSLVFGMGCVLID